MGDPGDVSALAGAASALAAGAADTAGVAVGEVHELDQLEEVAVVIDAVWHRPRDPVAVDLLRALDHSGNCILAAWAGGRMVGASVAFRGLHDGRPCLHSHITGVLPSLQLRGAGRALKLRQRAWALANGIDVVTWTFDPLVARNAHFNLTKLGADADAYLVDFYGPLRDEVNRDDATDRLLAAWRLTGPRATRALSGRLPVPAIDALRESGYPVVLDIDAGGRPALAGLGPVTDAGQAGSDRALLRIPGDIATLRSGDAELAGAWRLALRQAMTSLFPRGLRPLAAVAPGWYVVGPDGSDWPA
jgi:predicted GNAT superfamily acetyltransferase